MKKLLSILSVMTLSVMLFAQAPQSFTYQTVIRDGNWNTLNNQNVGIKISILEDAPNGTAVYEESHHTSTSQIGLVNLSIGEGTVMSGSFNTIAWGSHSYYIQVAVDVTGGTSYIVMGTTQLRSVPYALYADSSGTAGPPGQDGVDGIDGTNGTNGVDGNDGAPGVDGTNGTNGVDGYTPIFGVDYFNGQDGVDGIDGTNGINGVDGAVGPQGAIGLTGNTGATGSQGVPGNDGATGLQGVPGNDGSDGVDGAIGLTGATGLQGVPGNDGADGVDGATGLTGAQGIQGIAGIDGQDGATGPIGVTGNTGASGIDGTNGIDGVDGYTPMFGVDYFNGTDGTDGVDGNDGATGLTGAQGIQGATGNDGIDGVDGNNGMGVNCWDANADGVNDSIEDINNDGVWDALDCMWILQGAGSSLPVGVIQAYAGSNAPNDWLFCDGSAVSRTTYADLFTAIGESYGVGDGSTTFNLPDLRGRVPVGKDDMGGAAANIVLTNSNTLGNSGGEETHTLTVDEMPSHNHGIGGTGNYPNGSYNMFNTDGYTTVNLQYTTTHSGGNQPHNNMQPYLITNYIIKVSEGSTSSGGGGGSSASTTINYDSLANIISMDSTFLAIFDSNCNTFGQTIESQAQWINYNDTTSATLCCFELYKRTEMSQVNTDGILIITFGIPSSPVFSSGYGIYYGADTNNLYSSLYSDENWLNMIGSLTIPVKKDDYYFLVSSNEAPTEIIFFPFECGNSSSSSTSSLDSTTVAAMISNAAANSMSSSIPDFLKDVGSSTTDFYSDIQTTLISGEYDDLFIYNGDVVSLIPNQTTIIQVKDTCFISGTINGNGGNAQGSASNSSGDIHFMANGGGSGGGYTGGGTADNCDNSSESGSIALSINDYFPINALGASVNASFSNLSDAVHVFPYLHGGDGGTSYYWSGGNIYCGKPGGQGGAGLYIICHTLIFDGEIQLSGGNGTGCYQNQYGYHATGGGGSGTIVISSDNIINQTGTIIQNAGIGGGCANTNPYQMTSAGDGQIGTSYIVEF